MEIQPGSGRRISNRIAGSVRYFGRSFSQTRSTCDAARPLSPGNGNYNEIKSPSSLRGANQMAKTPVRVAVTGAAGQIGYSLLFPHRERRDARQAISR